MKKTAYSIKEIKVAQIPEVQMYSDVLERIAGYEEFTDYSTDNEIGEALYLVDRLYQILISPIDDTNETTKLRIEELYEQIKDFDYLILTKT